MLVRRGLGSGVVAVTFIIEAPDEDELPVSVVGDFNDWDYSRHLFQPGADGRWRATAEIPVGRSYEFRYLTGTGRWFDEPDADGRRDTGVAVNSVLDLITPC